MTDPYFPGGFPSLREDLAAKEGGAMDITSLNDQYFPGGFPYVPKKKSALLRKSVRRVQDGGIREAGSESVQPA